MATEHKVTLKAVLDTSDVKAQLAAMEGSGASPVADSVKQLEKGVKDAAKAQSEAADEAKKTAMTFKDAKNVIKLAVSGMAANMVGDVLGGEAGSAVKGAGQGAMLGSAFGPYGALAGGIIGGIDGLVRGIENSRQELEAALKQLADVLTKQTGTLKSSENWLEQREFGKRIQSAGENELRNIIDVLKGQLSESEQKLAPLYEIRARRKLSEDFSQNGKNKALEEAAVEANSKFIKEQEEIRQDILKYESQIAAAESRLAETVKTREAEERKKREEERADYAKRLRQRTELRLAQDRADKNLARQIEEDRKKSLSELDKEEKKAMSSLPDLVSDAGGMTSLAKYGFGMGEIEDSAISLVQQQLDIQTQIRNSVEAIRQRVLAGDSAGTAIAG